MGVPVDRLGAIVLAAGLSRRFGGPSKLLVPLARRPLLDWSLQTVASLGLKDVVVVTGRDADRTNVLAGKAGLKPVHNPDFQLGLGTSLAAGARAVDPACEGVFICLGDMPLVPVEAFQDAAAAFDPDSGIDIVIPVHEGRRGHPVLFGQSYFEALAALGADEGAKSLVKRFPERVRTVEIACKGVLFDVDWALDLAHAEDVIKARSLA